MTYSRVFLLFLGVGVGLALAETHRAPVGLYASRAVVGARREAARGVPPGVTCDIVEWCDSNVCSEVCARGTVDVPRWIDNAHRLQHRLSTTLPMCYANFFGTHNSAITLADGYGNQDPLFSGLLEYVEWIAPEATSRTIRTNDQYFSLTDQLNMGVRMVEIDTHYVLGSLRVAHCGGLHVDALDKLVEALNYVAKTLGYDVRWDTETVGCNPSLSSIPADYQRLFVDALLEIKSWMDDPRNGREFLIIYLDDEPDLLGWGVVPQLVDEIRRVFGDDAVFKPTDRDMHGREGAAGPADWPTVASLVDRGFRAMFVSSSDYGDAMASHVFARGPDVCDWREPGLRELDASTCELREGGFMEGSLLRTPSCQIQYGPLNCDFILKNDNKPVLDEALLRNVVNCGLNVPAPDLLTPARAAAAVWTWAPGFPVESGEGGCGDVVYVAASDGRWRTAGEGTSCEDVWRLPLACRVDAPPSRPEWVLADDGACPAGTMAACPRHPRENVALVSAIRERREQAGGALLVGARIRVDELTVERE